MQLIIFILVTYIATITAFRMIPISKSIQNKKCLSKTMMSEPEKSVELVPVDKVNTVNAAAVTGGFLGFVLGGPVLAAFLAAITNYVAKKEDDSGEALRGFGKTVVESYNFLNKLNTKYSLTGKVSETVSKAVSSIETESEVLDTVKKTYSSTTEKVVELNKEYDLVGKGKEIVVAAATLSDAAIEKAVELNEKYDLIAQAKSAAGKLVDKIKEATK